MSVSSDLFYKFGVKIKTPDPAFAAVCIVTSVDIIQVIILFGFLYSLEVHPAFNLFFDDSLIGKLVALAIGYLILLINVRYTFGLKRGKYMKFVEIYDKEPLKAQITKTVLTVVVILILPILGVFILWHILKSTIEATTIKLPYELF